MMNQFKKFLRELTTLEITMKMIHGSQRLEMLISEVYFSSTGLYLK